MKGEFTVKVSEIFDNKFGRHFTVPVVSYNTYDPNFRF